MVCRLIDTKLVYLKEPAQLKKLLQTDTRKKINNSEMIGIAVLLVKLVIREAKGSSD